MSDEALLSLADVELCVISAADTHALRLAVLRSDVPTKEVVFAEDDLPGVEHLGLRVHGELVAISSWVPRPHEGEAAVQLRGMATAKRLQSHGLGGWLLRAGCERASEGDSVLVWARARDAALDFYLRHGFVVEGEGFIDQATQLPHHVVVRRHR
jgi:predicted GNAT family N-acyltransferase